MGRTALYQLITFGSLLALWELSVFLGWFDAFFLPPPSAIGSYLFSALSDGTLLRATGVTFARLLTGFAIGVVLGIPLGVAVAYSRYVASTLGSLASGLQALPSVCWIPLALLWFGQTESAVIFVVTMGTLWSIVIAVADGIRSVPPLFVQAARTMGASGVALLYKVTLPASLPIVLSGMRQGWAFAWRSLLAAEIFVTILSGFGLGHLLHYGRELHAMDQVFGIMALILAVGLLTEALLFGALQNQIKRRWGFT